MTFTVLTLLWLATTTLGVSVIVVLDSIRARHHRPRPIVVVSRSAARICRDASRPRLAEAA
jgi:hypothetical protein